MRAHIKANVALDRLSSAALAVNRLTTEVMVPICIQYRDTSAVCVALFVLSV
jgi:hypothetical protein